MKINLIVLASGNSVRFRGNKLLAILKDKPLYLYAFDNINTVLKKLIINNMDVINKVIVVTKYDEIKIVAERYGFDVVINNESSLGISSSIRLGLMADDNVDGYMFMVCDQPYLSVQTIEELIYSFCNGNRGIVSTGYNNTLGNPKIFSNKYREKLLSLVGDTGGKTIISKNREDLTIIQVINEKELMDVDFREDIR